MAASVMASLSLKPSPFTVEKSPVRGLPTLSRRSFKIEASGVKKIKTDTPYGTGGGMNLRDGLDASGRKPKGKGVYQYVDKYGANVDGYSPIYNTDEWSPSGDVYAGGKTGLLIWAVTLAGILAGDHIGSFFDHTPPIPRLQFRTSCIEMHSSDDVAAAAAAAVVMVAVMVAVRMPWFS
ncbi:photosystem II 10 kDa polypeptide [Populus alba x Populus x berolinensis]|nr:photosystem II 10 kDa polypeptide [Populus alba x Populus x berolinensis]